jgi:hypothetical protein
MITKDYPSFLFQEKIQELPKNHQENIFVRSYFSDEINAKISEDIIKEKIKRVYYHDIHKIELVREFHKKHYSEIVKIGLLQTKSSNTVFLENYKNFEFQSLNIFRVDEYNREKEFLLFLKDYSISQYSEFIYEGDEQDELPVKEKVFYPGLWHMQEDELY